MADAAGHEAHEDLTCAGLGELDVLHDEWPAELLEHRGTDSHAAMLLTRNAPLDARARFPSNRSPVKIWPTLSA